MFLRAAASRQGEEEGAMERGRGVEGKWRGEVRGRRGGEEREGAMERELSWERRESNGGGWEEEEDPDRWGPPVGERGKN